MYWLGRIPVISFGAAGKMVRPGRLARVGLGSLIGVALRWSFGALLPAVCVSVAACSHDPIRYIPEGDRTMLQAQDRLGSGQGTGGPISVDEMLRRAKTSDPGNLADSRMVIRFEADAVQPDAAQRETLHRFAAQVQAQPNPGSVIVTSRPGSFEDPGSLILGQRRAIAVSRELSGVVPDVQIRFEAGLPTGVVVVSLGHAVAQPESASP